MFIKLLASARKYISKCACGRENIHVLLTLVDHDVLATRLSILQEATAGAAAAALVVGALVVGTLSLITRLVGEVLLEALGFLHESRHGRSGCYVKVGFFECDGDGSMSELYR